MSLDIHKIRIGDVITNTREFISSSGCEMINSMWIVVKDNHGGKNEFTWVKMLSIDGRSVWMPGTHLEIFNMVE